jgi:ABC-type nickel/cobalt efflux system permease component RcnA
MRTRLFAVDAAIAVALAIAVLIISPGLAITAILAIFVLLVCAVSFAFDGWRGRARRSSRAQTRPTGRRR